MIFMVINDCLFQDPTNLQTKLQKHQNFEAEVDANESRIESIRATGHQLIEKDHYAKGPIKYAMVYFSFFFNKCIMFLFCGL